MNLSGSAQVKSYRLTAIDALRGLVMIIMALDHTREMFHFAAYTSDPVDMATTTPALFMTRWITHFCAPVFVFLSGTSIYLQSLRKTKKELSAYLLKRGLWLILVDVVIMTFAITFDIHYGILILQVIWAIGISMVLLSGLIRLPFSLVATIGLLIVFGHNLLDYLEKVPPERIPFIVHALHRPTILPIGAGHSLGALYPFLPWTGVMLIGYAFGKIYSSKPDAHAQARLAQMTGLVGVAIFIILRCINKYGDPTPWSAQKTPVYTLLSFLNTQKYPPSLMYLCMTLGPALLLLSVIDRVPAKIVSMMNVYGRVPFFYYILHFYILHLATAIVFLGRGHSFRQGIDGSPPFPFHFIVPGEGVSLPAVYAIWIVVVSALYPLCRWFGEYKRDHRQWWLGYV